MKVLIVYPKMNIYGGAELLVVRLSNYLSITGNPNAILTTTICPEVERDLQGAEIIRCSFTPFSGELKGLNLPATLFKLHKGLREHRHRFDVINLHNYPAELSIFPLKTSSVWMCNEPPEVEIGFRQIPKGSSRHLVLRIILAFDRYVVRKYARNAVVADEFNRDRFRRIYGLDARIINYGIDHDFFAQRPPPSSQEKSDKGLIVLHVGMLTPLKNQIESVRTIEKLRDVIPGVKLILAGFGEGCYLDLIRDYIESNGLQEHVEITGHLDRSQVRNLYHSCDVLLHPIKSQGGWLSPFEAICARLPVVVSPQLTAARIIRENELGIVTDDYAGAILKIYQNRNEYAESACRKAEWVKDHLSWDSFSERMLRSFKDVLAGKPIGQSEEELHVGQEHARA